MNINLTQENFLKKLTIHIVLLLIVSCSGEKGENTLVQYDRSFKKEYTLKRIKDKEFLLDSATSVDKLFTYYYQSGNDRRVYILNFLDQTLHQYNWSGQREKKIKLAKEGPHGVGKPFSVFISNPNTIYAVDPASLRLIEIDSTGRVKKRYNLITSSTGRLTPGEGVLPAINKASQYAIFGNKIVMGGLPVDDCKRESFYTKGSVGLILDLQSGRIDSLIPMPSNFVSMYDDGNALSSQQIQFGQTYNIDERKAVINFPTENELYEVDLTTRKVTKHYAGSENFVNIEYASKNLVDIQKEFDYFKSQPAFPAIYHDKYRDLYLRFSSLPNKSKKERFDGQPWVHQSVIVLDKNFKKVGEAKLESQNWEIDAFIAPEGIYIIKDTPDENKLIYTLYEINLKK